MIDLQRIVIHQSADTMVASEDKDGVFKILLRAIKGDKISDAIIHVKIGGIDIHIGLNKLLFNRLRIQFFGMCIHQGFNLFNILIQFFKHKRFVRRQGLIDVNVRWIQLLLRQESRCRSQHLLVIHAPAVVVGQQLPVFLVGIFHIRRHDIIDAIVLQETVLPIKRSTAAIKECGVIAILFQIEEQRAMIGCGCVRIGEAPIAVWCSIVTTACV